NRDRRAPDFVQRPQRFTKLAQIIAIGTEVIVDEDAVRLTVGLEFRGNLRGIAHSIRHAQAVGREIAKPAAIVTAPGRDQTGGGQETLARQEGPRRRRISPVVTFIGCLVPRPQAACLEVRQNSRPKRYAIAYGERVRVRSALAGTGQDMQAAQDYLAAAGPV